MEEEIPLCFGTSEHSNTSLICRRCSFEDKCYNALKEKEDENKETIDAAA